MSTRHVGQSGSPSDINRPAKLECQGRGMPSPSLSTQTAQITETVLIVTPQHEPALPPSIEKGEMTFNFIGVLDNGQISVSRKASRPNTVDVINELNDGIEEQSEQSSASHQASARSSCS